MANARVWTSQITPVNLKKSTRFDDTEQFRQSFYSHYEDLHRYAYTLLRNNDEARDVVQDVFLKFWRNEKSSEVMARQYLYRAVYNTCMNRMRHEKVRLRYLQYRADTQVESEAATLPVMEKELQARIQRAIDLLPAQCRLIFLKSRNEEKRYAEIARELDISVKTVEAQVAKALRILRGELADYLVMIIIALTILNV